MSGALPVIGAVGGFLIGGPAGAVIGAGLGSFAAGAFGGGQTINLPEVQGPRLSDLRVQTSNYGKVVPIVYGTARLAGNVIWAQDIKEVKVTTTTTSTQSGGKGGGGSKPAAAYLWQSSGYALFRPDWTPGAWSKDTALYIGCWLAKISHGHFHPGGHFVLYSNGQTLLEDSGGPYVYGDSPAQRYFISPEAHNQVVVNGATFTTTSATVEAFGSDAGASWITLSHTGFAGCTIRRTIAIDHASKAVVVLDDVTCSQSRDIDLLWHLPAAAALSQSGARQIVEVGGTAALGVDVADLSAGVAQGLNDVSGNALQGWITQGYLQRTAAPVLTYRKTGAAARFVTVLQPVASASASGARPDRQIPIEQFR